MSGPDPESTSLRAAVAGFESSVDQWRRCTSESSATSAAPRSIPLDDLARCMDGNETENPCSPRFKKMQTPFGPSMHEFYIWTGDDDRCFGRYDGAVFEVNEIGPHR